MTGEHDREYETAISDLCQKQGVFFSSFYDVMKKHYEESVSPLYFDGDVHYNFDGFMKLSRAIYEWIIDESENVLGADVANYSGIAPRS